MRYQQFVAFFCFIFAINTLSHAGDGIPNVPQIPAFLPKAESVAPTKPMPLDGTWLINTISKKIRIESGRAYAVDGWVHLFTLKIQPGMVVIKNIKPTAAGVYEGEDLPLLGKWTAKVQADRHLLVDVAGTLGPVQYKLTPVQLDNPEWYAQEMAAAGLTAPGDDQPPPAYQPTPPPEGTPIESPPIDEEEEVIEEEEIIEDEGEDTEEMPGEDDFDTEDEGEDSEGEADDISEQKVPAKKVNRYSCKGKGVYYSKVNGQKYCYTCPKDFKRTSPTRKMDHPKACVNRKGKNQYKPAATRVKNVDGCGKGEFKSKGFCMACPAGYERYYIVDMYDARYGTSDCVPKS